MAWGINQLVQVDKFLINLPDKVRAKVHSQVILLGEKGPFLVYPYSKKVAPNLYELRIKGKDNLRIFYCFLKNQIWLVHGFRKKTQRLPAREIQTAIDRIKSIV